MKKVHRRSRNPVAKDLRTPKYRLRVLKDKRKQLQEKLIKKEIEDVKQDI
jgi:hypothetical protein